MINPTNFLDLDALADEAVQVVVKLKGVEHRLVQATVADFIANTKAIKNMAANGVNDLEEEVNMVISMIVRAFPTMSAEMLKALPLTSLNSLLDHAKKFNGENSVKAEVEAQAIAETEANPPLTAPSAP